MSLYENLFQWQKNLVDKFKHKDSFGLFLDMGLGKTPISLAFAEANNCTKVIVITLNAKATESKTLPDSWFGWARRSSIKYNIWQKKENSSFDSASSDLIVTNYESLFKRSNSEKVGLQLQDYLNDFVSSCKGHNVAVILDESHKVKAQGSKQSKTVALLKKQLSRHANHVYMYLLSGTPFTTGYMDLYNQLKLLGCNWTKAMFKDQFCVMGHIYGLTEWQQPIVGYKNIDMLYALLHQYAITIKSEEIIDLPDKIFINHQLPESSEFKLFTRSKQLGIDVNAELMFRKEDTFTEYETPKLVANPFYRNIAFPDMNWFADTKGLFWLRARQLSIGFQGNASEAKWYDRSRLAALQKFLSENEDNYVIFYNYTPELVEIYDICEKLGYNIDVYCGEIKSLTNYEKYLNDINNNIVKKTKNVIISNFASGSTGMNWQAYSHCIIFSIPLYKDYAQAIKRIHRVGQKETVFYHTFYQDNMLDSSMIQSLNDTKDYNEDMFMADISRIQEVKE